MGEHIPYLEVIKENLESNNLIEWYIINNEPNIKMDHLSSDKIVVINGTNNPYTGIDVGPGMHHADGLRLGISKVKTEWVVVWDPDFFIIEPSIVDELIDLALNKELELIGTPWFPLWIGKRINCVALHFAVSKTSNFDNNFEWYPQSVILKAKSEIRTKERLKILRTIRNYKIINFLYTLTLKRFQINKLLETASDLEKFYKNGKTVFLGVAISKKQVSQIFAYLPAKFWLYFESKIPRKLSYFPNESRLLNHSISNELEQVEHFYLGNKLMGLHLRSFGNRLKKTSSSDMAELIVDYIKNISITMR
jgi:hypothetical protein